MRRIPKHRPPPPPAHLFVPRLEEPPHCLGGAGFTLLSQASSQPFSGAADLLVQSYLVILSGVG